MFMLFPEPYNLGRNRNADNKEIADKNLNTSSDKAAITTIISENGMVSGTARRYSHVFAVTQNITAWSGVGSVSIANGDNVKTTKFENKDYTLYTLPTAQTAQRLNFAMVGARPKTYQLAVLDDTNAFIRENDALFDIVDIGNIQLGTNREAIDGSLSHVPTINGMSDKWQIRVRCEFYASKHPQTLVEELIAFLRNNKHFFFCFNTSLYPYLCFNAILPNPETQIRFMGRAYEQGRRVSFSVRER